MPILVDSSGGLLVQPADLADFPGAPFADIVVVAASESVRTEAGWHIAPQITETLRVFSDGGTALLLPTLKYSVAEVRDVSGDTSVTLTGWTDRGSGILLRRCWPAGHMLEVDVTHGYASCPQELLPAVAFRCQRIKIDRSVSSKSLGDLSYSLATPNTAAAVSDQPDAIIQRFKI